MRIKHLSAFALDAAPFAGSAQANTPALRCIEVGGGDALLLAGTQPDAENRVVAAAARELGPGHLWRVFVQLVTDLSCNAQAESNLRVLHSSPNRYVTSARVMAIDNAWIEDDSDPVTRLLPDSKHRSSGAGAAQPMRSDGTATITR